MSDESSNDKKGKGFAGLDSMVSDVSKDVGNASKPEPTITTESASTPSPPTPTSPHIPTTTSSGDSRSTGSDNTGKGKIGWIIAGAIVLFIFIINVAQKGKQTEAPAPYAPEPEAAAPAPEAVAPAPVARVPAKPSKPSSEKPPVGRNEVLNVGQIRYCLTEKIRMDAYEGVINNAREDEISRFNVLVNDYNSRCGEFRYYRGDLERAQRDVEASRDSITASAQRDWVRNSVGLRSIPTQPDRPAAPSQMPTQPSVPCKSDTECSGSQFCIRGKCSLPVRDGEACDRTDECAGTKSQCVSGKCKVDTGTPITTHIESAPRNTEISSLSSAERQSIESACSGDKVLNGPAAYNRCLANQLAALRNAPRYPDMSSLSSAERQSIESACSGDKVLNGPAAYNRCLYQQLRQLNP